MANILLIEDDAQFREMLAQMLNRDGHRVTLAQDGEEGLRLCGEVKPDLIMTDILMPRKDGIEVIMEMNQREIKIPIIAISGGRRSITAEFNLESADLVGVRATLAKPFTRDELRSAIDQVLD